MYLAKPGDATLLMRAEMESGGFELRVTLDKLFCAAAREAHRHSAVVIIAFNPNYGSSAISRMANFSTEHWIRIRSTLQRRASKRTWT
jgi:hypothetical protein